MDRWQIRPATVQVSYIALTMVLSKSLGFTGCGEGLAVSLGDMYRRRAGRRSEPQGEKSHSPSQEDNNRPPSLQTERISATPLSSEILSPLWASGE